MSFGRDWADPARPTTTATPSCFTTTWLTAGCSASSRFDTVTGIGHQCFAIQATADPLDSYHLYDFFVSEGTSSVQRINDYPKLGVWPDGYYYTANEFTKTGGNTQFAGAIAAVFEREKMLAGEAAQGVRFGPLPCIFECYFSLQPSHLEGPQTPPAGTPNTFVMAWDDQTFRFGLFPDGYRLWDLSVNWADLLSSTFSLVPVHVPSPPFDAELCGFSRDCIPQKRTKDKVDAMGQFTMYRAQGRYDAGTGTQTLEVVSKMVLWQREEKKEACEEKRLRETEEDLAI